MSIHGYTLCNVTGCEEKSAATDDKPAIAEQKPAPTEAASPVAQDKPAAAEAKPAAAADKPAIVERTSAIPDAKPAVDRAEETSGCAQEARCEAEVRRQATRKRCPQQSGRAQQIACTQPAKSAARPHERTLVMLCTRFRTYNASSRTYRGYDGQTHSCR